MTDKQIIVRLIAALKGLRYYSNDGGCWCDPRARRTLAHDIDCKNARAAIAELLQPTEAHAVASPPGGEETR